MSKRVCAWPRCPQLITQGHKYCTKHQHQYDQQRGTTTQRGYGSKHQQLRKQWATLISQGTNPPCSRCGKPIQPTDSWQLDHTDNRHAYLGPAHTTCNEQAGQANSIRMREHWTH